jgi:hypothetical protein
VPHNPQFFRIRHTNPPKINLHDTHASQTNATIYNLVTNTKKKKKGEGRNKKTSLYEERRKKILVDLSGERIAPQILHLLPSNRAACQS